MNSFHLFMPFIGTYHNNDIAIALIPIVHFLFGIHSMVKTWFITGTSTGLGRLLTERLLERGDQVVATLRRPGALDELLVRPGNRLHVLTLDVTDTRAVRTVMAAAFDRPGHIDVVVNNAGYGLFGAGEEAIDEQIDRQIATNLVGSIQCIRAALPHLRRQGGGRIVQVSSEGGQIAYPNFSLYHATKWGIEGFVESVAKEVASFGIDFLIVEPGPTGTHFAGGLDRAQPMACRSEEHTSELQSLMRISYAVFCLKKKKHQSKGNQYNT